MLLDGSQTGQALYPAFLGLQLAGKEREEETGKVMQSRPGVGVDPEQSATGRPR